MVEIEVKIKVENFTNLKKRILAQNASLEKERYMEDNILYDDPTHVLSKKNCALRLRTINKKTFLTFKGPEQKSRKFKIRQEYQTQVKNGKDLKKILHSLGLVPMFHYRKHRTVYRQRKLKICLDELSIGNFLELEGKQTDIVHFAKALGFSKKEFIKEDYVQLLKDAEKKQKN